MDLACLRVLEDFSCVSFFSLDTFDLAFVAPGIAVIAWIVATPLRGRELGSSTKDELALPDQ